MLDSYVVYVLVSERKKIYIGYTAYLEKRLHRHNNQLPNKKSSFSHKNGSQWKVVYTESFDTRSEAMKREKELKSFRGRESVRAKIEESNMGA
jgi:putative endonuclease